MDADGNTHFNPGFHDVWIQHFAASRHIGDSVAKAIPDWTAGLLKDDCATRRVLCDRSVGIGRGRRGCCL